MAPTGITTRITIFGDYDNSLQQTEEIFSRSSWSNEKLLSSSSDSEGNKYEWCIYGLTADEFRYVVEKMKHYLFDKHMYYIDWINRSKNKLGTIVHLPQVEELAGKSVYEQKAYLMNISDSTIEKEMELESKKRYPHGNFKISWFIYFEYLDKLRLIKTITKYYLNGKELMDLSKTRNPEMKQERWNRQNGQSDIFDFINK